MIRAVLVAGTRPNFMKVSPLHRAMAATGAFDPMFVHTGQHYDWEMSAVFLRELGLPDPQFQLGVGSGSREEQITRVMHGLEPILAEHEPDVVVVVGDVNSTLGAALIAVQLGIPVAHVEAGLRSFDQTMPEEVNRLVVDSVSDFLFAPSVDAVQNLRAEGVDQSRIHHVGNVMIDSLDAILSQVCRSDIHGLLELPKSPFALATVHRAANVDEHDALARTVEVLGAAAEELPVVLPVHPRTRERLETYELTSDLANPALRVIEPLGYVDFLSLVTLSACVLTDSGGIQEETTVLGVPCLTLRDKTERPITVLEGTNVLVGMDPTRVRKEIRRVLDRPERSPRRPALWDGRAANRVTSVLSEAFSSS